MRYDYAMLRLLACLLVVSMLPLLGCPQPSGDVTDTSSSVQLSIPAVASTETVASTSEPATEPGEEAEELVEEPTFNVKPLAPRDSPYTTAELKEFEGAHPTEEAATSLVVVDNIDSVTVSSPEGEELWRVGISGFATTAVSPDNERVYITDEDETRGLRCYDAAGKLLWQSHDYAYSLHPQPGGALVTNDGYGNVARYGADGSQLWNFSPTDQPTADCVPYSQVLLRPEDQVLLDAGERGVHLLRSDGIPVWSNVDVSPMDDLIVDSPGTIYFVDGTRFAADTEWGVDPYLTALSEDGTLRWKTRLMQRDMYLTPQVNARGQVLTLAWDGSGYLVDSAGNVIYELAGNWRFVGNSTLLDNGVAALVLEYDPWEAKRYFLYVVGPDGRLLLSRELEPEMAVSLEADGSGSLYRDGEHVACQLVLN